MLKLATIVLFLCGGLAHAANYPLQITSPETSIGAADRIYKAYTGTTYTTETVVFGGTYPFTFSLSNAPSGMSINSSTGKITWTNPQASASNIEVTVTDAESNSDSATWSITVGTSGFYFVDADAGSGGDGSIGSPWDSMDDFYLGASDTTYQDAIIYFYTGTYTLPYAQNDGSVHDSAIITFNSGHPVALLEYPGEAVVFNHDQSGNPCTFNVTRDNFYIDGINLNNGYSHMVLVPTSTTVDYLRVFNCDFTNMTGSGSNVAAITYYGDGPIQYSVPVGDSGFSLYPAIQFCTFDNIDSTDISAVCDYGTKFLVFHGNTVENMVAFGAVTLKSSNTHTMIRASTFNDVVYGVRVLAQYYASNVDISFNNFISCDLQIGNYAADSGPENIYIYRNTINGLFIFTQIGSDDGPAYTTDNVVINSTPADHIRDETTEHYSITEDVNALSGNLMGESTDNIIDESGLLQGSYRTTYLGSVGWEIGSEYGSTVSLRTGGFCTGGISQ